MSEVPLGVAVPKRPSKRKAGAQTAPKAMAAKRRVPLNGKRYGTRGLVLQALKETAGSKGSPTSDIIRRVRKLSGVRIPEQSFRQALGTLARSNLVRARRAGQEKTYKLVQGAETPAVPQPTPTSPETLPGGPVPPMAPSAAERAVSSFPHKLAVGEVLVLFVGETHVEMASNVHGKVVLGRHVRPR